MREVKSMTHGEQFAVGVARHVVDAVVRGLQPRQKTHAERIRRSRRPLGEQSTMIARPPARAKARHGRRYTSRSVCGDCSHATTTQGERSQSEIWQRGRSKWRSVQIGRSAVIAAARVRRKVLQRRQAKHGSTWATSSRS